ncbi:MAG: tetratricopeptide repeat protein [Proteobacteria bacterium]|nr:tetratricopeptide repeat protein [Pseudomonadota bacterium]
MSSALAVRDPIRNPGGRTTAQSARQQPGPAVARRRSDARPAGLCRRTGLAPWLACLLVVLDWTAAARAQQVARAGAQLADIEAKVAQLRREPIRRSQLRSPTYVEERLAEGELLYRLRDYVRASVLFTDLVQNHGGHAAYADALFLLGDSLFLAGDLLGARRRFTQLLGRSDQAPFRPHVQKSLGRLIEIAIHTNDFRGVDEYFRRLAQIPPSQVEAATHYFRGKLLYSRAVAGDFDPEAAGKGGVVDQPTLEQARLAFAAVAPRTPYVAQARYFVGVVYTLRGQYAAALRAFGQVVRAPSERDERQAKIEELAQLALGRLHYETGQLDQAITAYQRVKRTSDHFGTALFEVAWVHIKRGDSTEAERALELLQVARPDSHYIPDAKVLRGNLLLREGRYDAATKAFTKVASDFGQVRNELDAVLARHADPASYFRELVRRNMRAFDADAFLPPMASRWMIAGPEMSQALEVLTDLSATRQLATETRQIALRLDAALRAPNPVTMFTDLRLSRERSVGLRNRLAAVRAVLIEQEAAAAPSAGGEELGRLRTRRRELERLLAGLPRQATDFRRRNNRVLHGYDGLEHSLSELDVELLGLNARVTATERFIQTGGVPAGAGVDALRAELERHADAIKAHQERVKALRAQVEAGRLRVGVGDESYRRDVALRREYRELVGRERALLAQHSPVHREMDGLFRRVTSVEQMLDAHDEMLRVVVQERIGEMSSVLNEESQNLVGYQGRMTLLEGEAEGTVGGVAHASFHGARKRFHDLVLRADVGKVDVAWAQREEHRTRIEMLTRERAREIKVLDDEFREIMDETTGKGEGS